MSAKRLIQFGVRLPYPPGEERVVAVEEPEPVAEFASQQVDRRDGVARAVRRDRCRSALQRRKMHPWPSDVELSVSDQASELWDVLTRLSDDQRIAVVLRFYGGYPASDIAEMLDMPAATVRSHLRRGLAMLRKELEA